MERRSELRRKRVPTRTTPSKPRPSGRVSRQKWQELRGLLFERAGGRCEWCGARFPLGCWEAHHRKARSQGGADELANLAALCGPCHSWAHEHPVVARGEGFILPRGRDVTVAGFIRHDGAMVLPDQAGGFVYVLEVPR